MQIKKNFKFIIVLIFPLAGLSQQPAGCNELKNGKFFYYSLSTPARYIVLRKEEVQMEIDLAKSDTTYWEIEWLNDCTYSMNYKGGGENEGAYLAMFKKHKNIVVITAVTPNYYTYTLYRDKVSDIIMSSDTIWRKEKTVDDRTFKKSNFIEASFTGGDKAWSNYIREVVVDNLKALSRQNKSGTCYVSFIVDTDGTVTQVEALTMEDTKLAKISVNAIKDGPAWKPARLNGKPVKAFRIQPVTFTIVNE